MNNSFCKNCGAPVQAGSNVCANCGTPVSAPPINNQQVGVPMNQNYGQQMPQQQMYGQAPVQADSGSIGWGILGFFIPLVGWILYFVWKDTKPQSAKMAGIGGLIGFVVNVILIATGAVRV